MDEIAYPGVAGVAVTGDRVLRVLFRDGLCGDVLLIDPVLVGRLEALRDPAYLAQVRVDQDAGVLVWPKGETLGRDDLYAEAEAGELL